jgi:hypothetical protein
MGDHLANSNKHKDANESAYLNELIHRRPAYAMTPPAIVRHLVFRMGAEHDPNKPGVDIDRALSDAPSLDVINDYVQRISQKCFIITSDGTPLAGRSVFGHGKFRNTRIVNLLLPGRNGTPSGHPLGFRLRLRFDLHKEYFGVTQAVDKIDLHQKHEFPPHQRLHDIVTRLADSDHVDDNDDIEFVYEQFWRDLENETGIGIDGIDAIKFGDFRGLIISADKIAKTNSHSYGLPQQQAPGDAAARHHGLTSNVSYIVHNRAGFLDKILYAGSSAAPDFASRAADVVLCGMLDGRALFASSLGQGEPTAYQRYFVAYDGQSHAQLGRLIRRLHVFGEMRLAALIEYQDLSTASKQIRRIEHEIDHTALKVAKIWSYTEPKDSKGQKSVRALRATKDSKIRNRELPEELFPLLQRRIVGFNSNPPAGHAAKAA